MASALRRRCPGLSLSLASTAREMASALAGVNMPRKTVAMASALSVGSMRGGGDRRPRASRTPGNQQDHLGGGPAKSLPVAGPSTPSFDLRQPLVESAQICRWLFGDRQTLHAHANGRK